MQGLGAWFIYNWPMKWFSFKLTTVRSATASERSSSYHFPFFTALLWMLLKHSRASVFVFMLTYWMHLLSWEWEPLLPGPTKIKQWLSSLRRQARISTYLLSLVWIFCIIWGKDKWRERSNVCLKYKVFNNVIFKLLFSWKEGFFVNLPDCEEVVI